MEKEKPRKERLSVRMKHRILKQLKRKRSIESDTPDPQLPKEIVGSECDEIPQRVELPGISHDKPEQQQDISSPAEETTQATQDETSASDEKLLKDMPSEGHKKLVMFLQPLSATGRDYRSLADKMGYSNEYIQHLGSTNDPVMNLIKDFERDDRKISELTSLLREMERVDVLEELQPYIDATSTPREIEQRQQRLAFSNEGKLKTNDEAEGKEENEELRTTRDSYDAFVCYAKKDNDFVYKKLVKKMEGPPYNLKLCLSERDFLGGGCYLETAAVAIEQRCKKLVAILSTNFDNSEGARYESHIAMSLKPGAKKERYIPVLIEDAYRDKIPRTIQHLYYLDYTRIEESIFWKRLAESLGWTHK